MKTILDIMSETFDKRIGEFVANEADYVDFFVPLNVKLAGNICIVDIETTGLFPDKNTVVTFGIIEQDRLVVIQRLNGDIEYREEFVKFIRQKLSEHCGEWGVNEIYAYYCDFERRFLGNGFPWTELMPYRMKKDECIKFAHFDFGVGKDVVKWWHAWRDEIDVNEGIKHIKNIVLHNTNCLMKELAIFLVSENNVNKTKQVEDSNRDKCFYCGKGLGEA